MEQNAGSLRVVMGYHHHPSGGYQDIGEWYRQYAEELRAAGHHVDLFCLTLDPPGPMLPFPQLDRMWQRGDRRLLSMYEQLEAAIQGNDVLLNTSGVNLHPEFVEQLPVFTVFQCFDDPESSEKLSRPVAAAYDLCLVGNAAEVHTYRSWGVRRAEWVPMGLLPGSYDTTLTEQQILEGHRDIDLVMLIDRLSPPRRARMDAMAEAFPDAHFYGNGWPRGPLRTEPASFLSQCRIGPNFHNSTGPVNFRLFQLPANGVMQICDNKSHLSIAYESGSEIVGFDTVDECIDLCRYYLAHDQQRREIAAAGWRRVMRDYTAVQVHGRKLQLIQSMLTERSEDRLVAADIAQRQRLATTGLRLKDDLKRAAGRAAALPGRVRNRMKSDTTRRRCA
jgi:spore maturation protein CgeB